MMLDILLTAWLTVGIMIAFGGWKRHTPYGRIVVPLTWPLHLVLVIATLVLVALATICCVILDLQLMLEVKNYSSKIWKKKEDWKA